MSFFKLNKEVSETTDDIDADDVLNTKSQLKNLGYYQTPDYGMTKISDRSMFDGIRKFQTDNKLKVDGIAKPGGETENKINENVIKLPNLRNPIKSIYDTGYNIGTRIANTRTSAENTAKELSKEHLNDKYKHAYLSCKEAQKGLVEATTIAGGGLYKEYLDQRDNKNTISESLSDLKADTYGIYKGISNRKEDCDELVQKKYKK